MQSGRAFRKPLPFMLGTNGHMITSGTVDTVGLSYANQMGMKIYRNDVPWSGPSGTAAVFENLPGSYDATNIGWIQEMVAAVKNAGLIPIIVIGQTQNPSMCPLLGAALTNGDVYTSINIGAGTYGGGLAYAISSGDSIVITDPTQTHTQTVTAAANMAAGASGSLTVSSFTANYSYPVGTWTYNTKWPACTPQHLANGMAYLVQQTGLQGIHWEIFNEPDDAYYLPTATGIYVEMMKLVYPAMKAADPTCTVHGFCVEQMSPPGNGDGIDWATPCYEAGMAQGVTHDVVSVHGYNYSIGGVNVDCAPDAINVWGMPFWQNLAHYRAFMLSQGDSSPMWWTECNWPDSGGAMTAKLQAQYLQDLLVTLSGHDPINGVSFSSYLEALCIYEQTGTSQNLGLIPNDTNNPNPAVAILTELVSGH